MKVHDLKCHPEPFQAMALGLKTFEFRKDDRDFQEGDHLRLREYRPPIGDGDGAYTRREILVRVTYLVESPSFGIPDGYVVMSVSPLIVTRAASSTP